MATTRTRPERIELVLRASLVLILLFGGLGKMAGWSGFVDQASAMFRDHPSQPLPDWFVRGFLWIVPPVEAVLGALLLTRFRDAALLVAGALLLCFQFGHMVLQDFAGVSRVLVDQLLIAAVYLLPRRERLSPRPPPRSPLPA